MHPFLDVPGLWLNGVFHSREALLARDDHRRDNGNFVEEVLDFAKCLALPQRDLPVTTSGSTGTPKILKHPKTSVWLSAEATNAHFGLQEGTRALLSLPMGFIAGKMMVARAMAGGYELLAIPPTANPLAEVPAEMKIDFAPLTPHQAAVMVEKIPARLARIGKILLGGGMADTTLRGQLVCAGCRAFIGFGMAETLSHFAVAEISPDAEPEYVPLPGVRVETEANGRLVVHRPDVLDAPLRTNDIVEFTPKGFRFLGRADNAIVSGGINIFPEEIERKIAPFMAGDFFVAGTPHPIWGAQVTLFVSDGRDENRDLSKAGLSAFEKPKKVVGPGEFLYTDSGKIRRRATVKKWLEEGF